MNHSRRRFLKAAASGVLAGTVVACRTASGRAPESSASNDESPVASVRYLGSQFLDNPVGVTGADGATSTVLPSGDSLWLFGDTVEGPFESIHRLDLAPLASNTAVIVPKQDASQGIKRFQFLTRGDGKRPRQVVPLAPDEDPAVHRVWAIHGTCIGQRIYLFYHRITLLKGVDVFVNFQLDGMGLARAHIDEFQFARLTAPDGTREFWKGHEPSFGVFVERVAHYIYLWGCLATGMHLARTRPESIENLAEYEYLVEAPTSKQPEIEPRWSKEFQPTAVLFDAVPNEMSAAYNPYLQKHVAFHTLHRENKIVMRTAPRIIGPWSDGEIVYRPERIKEADLIYAAKEHPELAREDGRVMYVTFVNSSTYVPQLVEVTLK
ncbi:MAG: DUF4185 domain-containing protein [Pirellulales bacterium]